MPGILAAVDHAGEARHAGSDLPFCAIKFDCGCGTGEILICRKLAENTLLTALSAGLIFWPAHRFCLRHSLRLAGAPTSS